MNKVTQRHHDGHGLNDRIEIVADEPDHERGGGAKHAYEVKITDTLGAVWNEVARMQFQHGPRDEPESSPGITDAVLISIVLDRYYDFQSGPYRCRENAIVITKLEEAMHWMRHRADERASRGVLGKNEL